jgi:hypothetical protein
MPWYLTKWVLWLYFASKGRLAVDFYHPSKSIASAGFEPASLRSNGKHANHFITEATILNSCWCLWPQISLGKSSQGEWGGRGMWHAWERREKCTRFRKPEGKRPLGRPRRRWEDRIRMDLMEIGLGVVDWIRLAQDRDRWRAVVSAVMSLRVLAPLS